MRLRLDYRIEDSSDLDILNTISRLSPSHEWIPVWVNEEEPEEETEETEGSEEPDRPSFKWRQWWFAEDVPFIHITPETEEVIERDSRLRVEESIEIVTQSSITKNEIRIREVVRVEPKDHPPDQSKTDSIERGDESRFSISKRIVHIEPMPKLPLPMFSRIANPMANGSIRGEILEYIRTNPGEHMSKIKRKFKLSTSSTVHHLSILEKNGFILAHKDGKFKRYFANENGYRSSIDGEYKAIFSVLKNENSRQIAHHLISNPHSTLSEVSMVTGLNPSTIHWHAERLEAVDIISKSRDGKFVRYFVEDTEIVKKVIALLNT
jgi:DNA-binding transcriptional ArsR family regulator